MDFSAYGELDKEDQAEAQTLTPTVINVRDKLGIVAAPYVADTSNTQKMIDFKSAKVFTNPTYSELWQNPVQGAYAPWSNMNVVPGGPKNIVTGFVEDASVNDWAFDLQLNSFQSKGHAFDPQSNDKIVRQPEPKKRKKPDPLPENEPAAPVIHRDADAPPERALEDMEEKESDDEGNEPPNKKQNKVYYEPTVTVHHQMTRDYQGRSWVEPNSSLKKDREHRCFLPKKQIHTWTGHSKGVTQIRFFPGYGHLLLSASFDNTVKIWDVYGKRQCIQTWAAHEKGVKDINFSPDGTRFLSCGYDNYARMFDVETGQCLASFTKYKTPHCGVFYPREPNIFLVGQANKKIIQWDMRSKRMTQEYDRHLGAINTVSFIDDNRRFVSTSDDKSIRVWEFGIGVEIKYIAEPHMHAIAQTRKTYDDRWLLCQSNDNQILVYSAKDKFKLNRKKTFKGHSNAGYSVGVDSSPDGQYVLSGTADGGLVVWDWQTCKIIKQLKAHQKVTSGCAWHPIEPSKVASCSWDGTIKFWD